MRPSVGRVVHYVSYGSPGGEYKPACRAAVVTEVPEDAAYNSTIGLCVLNPTGQFFNRANAYDEGTDVGDSAGPLCGGRVYHGGSWHWPEKV